MTRVVLHELPGAKRAGELARLVDQLHREGRRVVVWVQDEGRRQVLDDYLWTFNRLAFVPHTLWQEGMEAVDDPVVLVGEPVNPNGADVLAVGDELPPEDWARTFAEVHDLMEEGAGGEARRAWWLERFPAD